LREKAHSCHCRPTLDWFHVSDAMKTPTDGREEDDITCLLSQWRTGSDNALNGITALLYDELRRAAAMCLHGNWTGQTMQPTALVHEFYLKVCNLREIDCRNRSQFIGTAARVMRNILIDAARQRNSIKRGGGNLTPLGGIEVASPENGFDVLLMDLALDKFAFEYPRHAQVVELIFFGGLNAAEAAQVLGGTGKPVSQRTVERDWRFARCWLQNEVART
jgi:RNA polymerase sigma-70 factor (ECF subfamily)